jgi:hypothetical protein
MPLGIAIKAPAISFRLPAAVHSFESGALRQSMIANPHISSNFGVF